MSVPYSSALFTLLGFAAMYALLAALFVLLLRREIQRGPAPGSGH